MTRKSSTDNSSYLIPNTLYRTFLKEDISQNPNHWININQAKYVCPDSEIAIERE